MSRYASGSMHLRQEERYGGRTLAKLWQPSKLLNSLSLSKLIRSTFRSDVVEASCLRQDQVCTYCSFSRWFLALARTASENTAYSVAQLLDTVPMRTSVTAPQRSYGDYDHGAIWFGLEPAADAAAANAQVLFLGNSRTAARVL